MRRVTLDDGSVVMLNSGSRFSVHFLPQKREVWLERGEALFEVAKNKDRPFIVRTGEVSIRAVGTAFSVRKEPEQAVSIAVTEGTVEVSQPAIASQRVTINEVAVVQPARAVIVTHEDHATMERQLAWLNGMISFAGETLGAAVEVVNRYSRRKIVIEDPTLRSKPVIGIFRTGDVNAFAQTAAAALGADIHTEDGVIRLTPHIPP
jgi:transmembrane sensor